MRYLKLLLYYYLFKCKKKFNGNSKNTCNFSEQIIIFGSGIIMYDRRPFKICEIYFVTKNFKSRKKSYAVSWYSKYSNWHQVDSKFMLAWIKKIQINNYQNNHLSFWKLKYIWVFQLS